ncbi:MAG: glycine betaine ABC transporter substrate-binding protein [Propionibacteriaceae bacterium]
MSRLVRLRAGVVLMLLALVLAACGTSPNDENGSSQPQGAALRVRLGTQAFPEARLLGELWRQALAVNGYTVDLRKAVGPAEDLDQLLQQGEIDGYVAYTGTVLSVVAKETVTGLDPQQTYEKAKTFYATRGMAMSAMTPFQNKDAIAVTTSFAQAEKLESIGDLAKLDSFTFGARPEFEDLDLGLEGLKQDYGWTNAKFVPVPLGQQYRALDEGTVDAVDAFTTDPGLLSGNYRVLEDPKLLFGSQNVVMTVGEAPLKRVGRDEFLEVVDGVNAVLTEEAMVQMNTAVTDGQDEVAVAKRFLESVGLNRRAGG